MIYHKCRNCRRTVRESDRRPLDVRRGVDGYSYTEPDGGCVTCAPSEADEDRARDGRWNDVLSQMREGR